MEKSEIHNDQNIYGSVTAAVKEINIECGLGYV